MKQMKATIYSDDVRNLTEVPCKLDAPEYRHGQGADGYGVKIQSDHMIRLPHSRRWYRVYATQISNAGSLWVEAKGVRYHIMHIE